MANISIVEIDLNTYQVTVVAQTTSSHTVTMQADYVKMLTYGSISNTKLLKKIV